MKGGERERGQRVNGRGERGGEREEERGGGTGRGGIGKKGGEEGKG